MAKVKNNSHRLLKEGFKVKYHMIATLGVSVRNVERTDILMKTFRLGISDTMILNKIFYVTIGRYLFISTVP